LTIRFLDCVVRGRKVSHNKHKIVTYGSYIRACVFTDRDLTRA